MGNAKRANVCLYQSSGRAKNCPLLCALIKYVVYFVTKGGDAIRKEIIVCYFVCVCCVMSGFVAGCVARSLEEFQVC